MGKLKRTPRPFIKIKRLSRRTKMIPLDRDVKEYVMPRKCRERDNIRSILETIATVNFKALKITANPDIDVDYARKISAISIYGHIYRNPSVRDNISEDFTPVRSDVMHQLRNLGISDENEGNRNASHHDIVFDVSQKTFSLRINDNNEPDISDGIKNIVVSDASE